MTIEHIMPCSVIRKSWNLFMFSIKIKLNFFTPKNVFIIAIFTQITSKQAKKSIECRTPEREVRGSRPTSAVLCPWARHFTPRKYWLITQEAMAPSRHDWKIVDWDVKPQHNQPKKSNCVSGGMKFEINFHNFITSEMRTMQLMTL